MKLSKKFVCEEIAFSTYEKAVSAPLFRKSFNLKNSAEAAGILICGLGFYDIFVNGVKITKGYLAPYVSNPDHYTYFDKYDIKPYLNIGENNAGIYRLKIKGERGQKINIQCGEQLVGGLKVQNSRFVKVSPDFIEKLTWCRTSHKMPTGDIEIYWERREDFIELSIKTTGDVEYEIDVNDYRIEKLDNTRYRMVAYLQKN